MKKMQPSATLVGRTCGGVGVSASEDQAAVEKVLAGDLSAFEEIVCRWQGLW